MISISRVDGKSEKIAALLKWLQLETLPGDDPIDTNIGYWWIAERQVSAITYHEKYGQVSKITVIPEMLI